MRLAPTVLVGALLAGCGEEVPPDRPADQGVAVDLGHPLDGGPKPDAADEADAGTPDAGAEPAVLEPGVGVTLGAVELRVREHTFADVVSVLGPGERVRAENTRAYRWTVDDGPVEVWFANSNLDEDSVDVDDTDRILWIRVGGPSSAETPEGLGIGAEASAVLAAYGPPEVEHALDGGRRLDSWYTRGLLVTYGADERAQAFTVTRAYPVAPTGRFDPAAARLELDGGAIVGTTGLAARGSTKAQVEGLLGSPDGEGVVTVGGAELTAWSYGFIGIELFFLGASDNVLFIAVHAPYAGRAGGIGVGSPRSEVDTFLAGAGYPSGSPSVGTAGLVCYGQAPDIVGVTYDEARRATTFSFRLLTCP